MRKYILSIAIILCLLLGGCNSRVPSQAEQKQLTMAVFQSESQFMSSTLRRWVNQYCEQHPEVSIQVLYYLDQNADFEKALNQIKIEINAGKGPDLIHFGSQYSPLEASCGIMADLYPFLEADDTIDEKDLYVNVLDSFAVGDHLYVLVPDYHIDSFTTTNDDLADLDRMNIAQLITAYNAMDENAILFPGETKKSVFGMICYGSLSNYIDWNAGTCNFDSDSFMELLNFANQFPLNLNISDDYSIKNILAEGRTLLYPVCIDRVYEMAGIRMLYGETPHYIGYPFDAGNGNMATITDIAIGITSTSNHKEEAWEFLRSLLESEFQDQVENGLPVRVSSLEQKINDAMQPEYDENGECIVKDLLRFEGEEAVGVCEITGEDAQTLRSIIKQIDSSNCVDANLYSIMMEEVEYLFNDDRDLEAVVDIIQNRTQIYVQESK